MTGLSLRLAESASKPVPQSRWKSAQAAEQQYWDRTCTDAQEFVRILQEKVSLAAWIAEQLPAGPSPGEWVEIGIGPLGVGCTHLMSGSAVRSIVGVEPLPLVPEERIALPVPLRELVLSCRSGDYRHHQASGEATGLESERFSFAACYNVLDHVQDPGALLAEVHRILAPEGKLILGCDVVSALSLLKFHTYVRHRHPRELGVLAHTFRFRASELRMLLAGAGFRTVASSRPRRAWIRDVAGQAERVLVLAEKDGKR
jgi:SAM-dependent methyltransferase